MKCHHRFLYFEDSLEKLERRHNLEDVSIHRNNNIRMDLRKIGWEIVDWMHLSQDKDQWRDLVNMVLNLRVL
jgi:hypothetical protein